jgi:hypothetical protein
LLSFFQASVCSSKTSKIRLRQWCDFGWSVPDTQAILTVSQVEEGLLSTHRDATGLCTIWGGKAIWCTFLPYN